MLTKSWVRALALKKERERKRETHRERETERLINGRNLGFQRRMGKGAEGDSRAGR